MTEKGASLIGYILYAMALSLTAATVMLGIGGGVWLLTARRRLLAAMSFLGAALVVWAYRRQYLLDANIEASLGVGSWDTAFIPLCLGGLVLVASVMWIGLSGRGDRPDVKPRQSPDGPSRSAFAP